MGFIDTIREFGSPAIIRGTLSIIFRTGLLRNYFDYPCFLRFLPRFTNFQTVQFEFLAESALPGHIEYVCVLLFRIYMYSLRRFFGSSELFANECGLRFHPQEYHNARSPRDTDWADHLNGIRLNMNQDPNEPEASSQNSRFGAR